ncbi:auxilin-like protein 1 [Lactuca sativa]|uniref:auxilin-like protein 1 n=1 Tax=Lactuca sativa TaxID=4236 RepID=UPI0022AFC736|nr:auxilin-like protein 1 [Lactuca sativa]
MESLSRPFHRRKLSNANSFSGKNAYDGVFSGHRPKFDGVPAVHVDEYREIFSSGQAASSIPVLDLSTLQESSDGSNLELGSTKPDYSKIFGGFRDEDIAVSYEELVARDKARARLSSSQSSQDLDDDLSNQSFDALKQFNMSYNKINPRSKDGLDGKTTTHVTQLHVVPGFTCFIDESASQLKKETKKQKSSVSNKVHSPEKQTSQTAVESKSEYHQDESLSDDKKIDLKSHSFKLSSPKMEIEKQKASIVNKVHSLEKKTAVESKGKDLQDDKKDNSKVSSLPIASAFNTKAASQTKMETEKKKSSETDNNVHPINFIKGDFPEKKAVESKSRNHQDESLSDDKKTDLKSQSSPKKEIEKQKASIPNEVHSLEKQTSETIIESKGKDHQDDKKVNLKSHNSKVSPSLTASATNGEPLLQSKKETDKKISSETDDDFLKKQTSQSAVESLSDDRFSKKFEADINLHSSSSSPPATSATNVNTWTWKSDTPGAFSSTCFDEELDVNSVAGASAAALRKAIEKAQESIRIAKEAVGRKKEGLKSFSSKSFKDSLKVKAARVENVSTGEEQKEKDNWIKEIFKARMANVSASQVSSNHKHGDTVVFSESTDDAKKVINEIHEKILETEKNSEIPMRSSHELKDDKIVYDSNEKAVEHATRSSEEIENESLKKDNQRPNGFFVLENIESKENKDEVGPSNSNKLPEETNNLALYQKVEEEEKKTSHDYDENGYEKRFSEALGLLENTKQEVVKHNEEVVIAEIHESNSDDEASEKVVEEEKEVKEESDTESHIEEEEEEEEEDNGEKFYDVCDVEIIENSSSDYDDAEESESIHSFHGVNRIEIDKEEACKIDQSDNNVEESSQEVDDVSNSSPQATLEDTEAIITEEKEIFETISDKQTQTASINNEDDDDDEVSHDMEEEEPELNDEKSESCSDRIHGMEIEVKECKETEETIKKEKEEEENNLQEESDSERPEVIFQMETGTSEEAKDMNDEAEARKEVEKEEEKKVEEVTNEERERERNRLVVERAIREARERSFNEARERAAVERATAEVRQRAMADVQEKAAMKASEIASKLKAERAAVERATAEARKRALEKAMSQKKVSESKTEVTDVRKTSSDLHISNGTSGESAQRSKAILEKHNRIKENVAKALAEKEKRDQLAQKEQAERSRIADNLDADIKRWSSGKEGNLRALLSTLQYILGPESGWQSVSLTEIITTSAVKKAYRKATLCVHPDKLQQRGASIQQKYICEKVFDLLKAAWNRFNSEER